MIMPGTRKLGRKTDHRLSMLKGMVTFLLEKGKIETTVTRAKEVSALADKMVTLGKANTLASRRQAMAFLKKESVVAKLFTVIAPLYSDRNGGYTRVLKTGPRRGDGAEMAIIAMVDAEAVYEPKDKKKKSEETKTETAKEAKKTTEKKSAASKKASASVDKTAPKKNTKAASKTAGKDEKAADGEGTAKKTTTRRTTKAKAEKTEASIEAPAEAEAKSEE
jgi:large subunit ribosomal protein L17